MEAWTAMKPFVAGATAGCFATACIQPMDMVKVRIQVNAVEGGSTSPFTVGGQILKNDGVKGLYKGLSAGFMRQIMYSGARLGLYDIFTDKAKGGDSKVVLGTLANAGCAISAGGIAAVFGNPADLSLVRMQTDTMLPEAERRGYKHVGDAFSGIVKQEGVLGLFKGSVPTATRAMALNLGMLAGNTEAKNFLHSNFAMDKSSPQCIFGASAIAGFLASFMSLPFDFIKTQVQKMKPDANGVMPYKGPVDCAMKTVAEKGITALWTGFPTYYFRIAPHAMITLIAQDQVKKFWKSAGL